MHGDTRDQSAPVADTLDTALEATLTRSVERAQPAERADSDTQTDPAMPKPRAAAAARPDREPATDADPAAAPRKRAARTAAPRTTTPRKTAPRKTTESDTVIGRIPVLDVSPLVDAGRRPAKAVVGEAFEVTATVFREGHDAVSANVVLRDPRGRGSVWTPMRELAPGTDRWGASVTPSSAGRWSYLIEAWSDPVATWRKAAAVKLPAGIDTALVLEEGAQLLERAAAGVPKKEGRAFVLAAVDALREPGLPPLSRLAAALAPEVTELLARHPLRELVTSTRPLPLQVDRERALFGSWYEFFPVRRAPSSTRPASSRRARAPCARPPSACPRSPRWASTWCTCRRCTRSGGPSARARTTP